MSDRKYTLVDSTGKQIVVLVRRDKRLTKSSRWVPQADGSILLRIPNRISKNEVGRLLDQLSLQFQKRSRLAEPRSDEELKHRAETINRKYFGGKIQWSSIRWVGNMEQRLGSCTNGGPTDGHIRISERIKEWPDWVIDYVIAHELVHRLHSNHSPEFWEILTKAYPMAERARGFIQGVSFLKGSGFDEAD